jgi:hypothetical protein
MLLCQDIAEQRVLLGS